MAQYDLRVALANLRESPQNFTLFRGQDADQILITPRPHSPADLKAISSECGELTRIFKGVCYREDSKLVFATRLIAAPAWEKMLAVVLNDRKCGSLSIQVRQLQAQEPEEVSGNGEDYQQSAYATAHNFAHGEVGEGAEEWSRLKTELVPAIKVALSKPETRDPVTSIVAAAAARERAKDFVGAIQLLEEFRANFGHGARPNGTHVEPAAPAFPPEAPIAEILPPAEHVESSLEVGDVAAPEAAPSEPEAAEAVPESAVSDAATPVGESASEAAEIPESSGQAVAPQ